VQASALALTPSEVELHVRPNEFDRTTREPVEVEASATQVRARQPSEVREVQDEGVERCAHVVPPSRVTSSPTAPVEVVALARQLVAELHARALMVAPLAHGTGTGIVHVVPPSIVEEIWGWPLKRLSTSMHDRVAKQSMALTPTPPVGGVSANIVWLEAL
jgi:hypothetical protein